MKIGQRIKYTSFLNGAIYDIKHLVLVSETSKDWRFKLNEDSFLTYSKRLGLDRSWISGENDTLKRRTLIEPINE